MEYIENKTFDEIQIGDCNWLYGVPLLAAWAVVGLPSKSLAAELQLKRTTTRISPLHGEPQVELDCLTSTLKIKPCPVISRNLWQWINSKGLCISQALSAAQHRRARARSVLLSCERGIRSDRRTRNGLRWSQHRYRRACDGTYIIVNGERFDYRKAVAAANRANPQLNRNYRYFVEFLDCWGTRGAGVDPGGTIVFDRNRGVRDWREDPVGHSSHFHLSKPCVECHMGDMAYE